MKHSHQVLLIEDDTDDQFIFKEALVAIGESEIYAVSNNGREALGVLESQSRMPDIIFTDINMPYMNGMECLRNLKKSVRLKDIPVIVLSSDRNKAEELLSFGANAFINKWSTMKNLQDSIQYCINYYCDVLPKTQPRLMQVS